MLPRTDLFDFDRITDWRSFSLDIFGTLETTRGKLFSSVLKT